MSWSLPWYLLSDRCRPHCMLTAPVTVIVDRYIICRLHSTSTPASLRVAKQEGKDVRITEEIIIMSLVKNRLTMKGLSVALTSNTALRLSNDTSIFRAIVEKNDASTRQDLPCPCPFLLVYLRRPSLGKELRLLSITSPYISVALR